MVMFSIKYKRTNGREGGRVNLPILSDQRKPHFSLPKSLWFLFDKLLFVHFTRKICTIFKSNWHSQNQKSAQKVKKNRKKKGWKSSSSNLQSAYIFLPDLPTPYLSLSIISVSLSRNIHFFFNLLPICLVTEFAFGNQINTIERTNKKVGGGIYREEVEHALCSYSYSASSQILVSFKIWHLGFQ